MGIMGIREDSDLNGGLVNLMVRTLLFIRRIVEKTVGVDGSCGMKGFGELSLSFLYFYFLFFFGGFVCGVCLIR